MANRWGDMTESRKAALKKMLDESLEAQRESVGVVLDDILNPENLRYQTRLELYGRVADADARAKAVFNDLRTELSRLVRDRDQKLREIEKEKDKAAQRFGFKPTGGDKKVLSDALYYRRFYPQVQKAHRDLAL